MAPRPCDRCREVPHATWRRLDDGTRLVHEVAFPPGHDKNPLTDSQLLAKVQGLAIHALGPERVTRLWERVLDLDNDARPHELVALLGPKL